MSNQSFQSFVCSISLMLNNIYNILSDTEFIRLLIVLAGVGATAIFTHIRQQQQNRIQTSLNLYSEFHSESMLKSRIEADSIFEKNTSELPLDLIELRGKLEKDDWLHISKIIHFFEKYAVCHNLKYLDDAFAEATLRRYFIHWYKNYLYIIVKNHLDNSSDEWNAWAKSIKELADKENIII